MERPRFRVRPRPVATGRAWLVASAQPITPFRRTSRYRTWNLLAGVAAGIVANTTYGVELAVKNSNPVHLEVWVNGTREVSYDDNSPDQIPSGTAGIEGASSGVRYANFSVEALQTQKMVIPAYFLLDK